MRPAVLVPMLVAAACVSACRSDRQAPPRPAPANLEIVSHLPASGIAGTVAGTLVVRVTDENAAPISGVFVTFAPTIGGGTVAPTADTTRHDGTASTVFTFGTMPGASEVTASVAGVASVTSATLTSIAGGARVLTLSPRLVRFSATQDSIPVFATPRDTFGNVVDAEVTWVSRDPALVSVTTGAANAAAARVLSRPGQTWLVASAGGATDSLPVAVHDASSTPCDFLSSPILLPVGGAIAFESTGLTCVRTEGVGAEYMLVAHYNTTVVSASANVSAMAIGVADPDAVFPASPADPTGEVASVARPDQHLVFERDLRRRERNEIGKHLLAARRWFRSRHAPGTEGRIARLSAAVREGDIVALNVNAFDFCTSPDVRRARVVALTGGTAVLADEANPEGGFTDTEYREFAMAMDTLVMPIDTAAFGAPSDVDGDGRIAILFTSAVNELTARGSVSGVVLGFYFQRDLVPKLSAFGACPGSNASEMFYMLVPDPDGAASDPRSKSFVQEITVATIAHELQHLINASRRMYVNDAPSVSEELWLNEGLSHIAEELLFYRASKLGPRQNIGGPDLLSGSGPRSSLDLFQRANFSRYAQYLRSTATNSPLAANDAVATRGAAWAFLRYVADRAGAADGDFWRRLVNSRTTGAINLDAVLAGTGLTTLSALGDWSVSVMADDRAAGATPALTQPSWNFVTALPETGFAFDIDVPALLNANTTFLPLRAGASAYFRFATFADQEALLQVSSGGGPTPQRGIRLTVVRMR